MSKMQRTIEVFLTAQGTKDRIAKKRSLVCNPDDTESENQLINIHEKIRFQKILGFGGAFTEAAAYTFYKLPPRARKQVLSAYFDAEKGNGYAVCRTHINSCDFSLGNYAYVDDRADTELKTFSVARDEQALIPFIQEAQKTAGKGLTLLASPWSPPAWMKTNNAMNKGGKLKAECRELWARYITKYLKVYASKGVKIWAITVQNEPKATQRWDSCVFTAEEERDFVKKYLGPALKKAGLGSVKIFVWDHNKERLVERGQTIFSDKAASKQIAGIGFHWYSGDHFEELETFHHLYPDKMMLFTEGCHSHASVGTWDTGEKYAHDIIGDLNHWTSGWCDWNLILDEHGGPNHVGNFCSAPIIADTKTGTLEFQSSYYYLGHFSRFIVPGSERVACSTYTDALEVTASRRPDGKIVVVVLNSGDAEVPFKLRTHCGTAACLSQRHSIMTMVY
ncbi:MAG: glycoside hydrolase family 30 protein [Spirochaetia bacterium]